MQVQGTDGDDGYGQDAVEAAHILTSGFSAQGHSGLSEELVEDHNETNVSEERSGKTRRVDVNGDVDMTANTSSGFQNAFDDACERGEDYPSSFVEEARSSRLCDYFAENPFE